MPVIDILVEMLSEVVNVPKPEIAFFSQSKGLSLCFL
jgi:hypothetical protein